MNPELSPFPWRAVLDTNTVLALWHFHDPALRALTQAIERGGLLLFARDDGIEELRRVLAYPCFALDLKTQQDFLASYQTQLSPFPKPSSARPSENLPVCRDQDDQKFLEAAVQSHAGLLVTRDKALLRLARHRALRTRLRILTPEQLNAVLREIIAKSPN